MIVGEESDWHTRFHLDGVQKPLGINIIGGSATGDWGDISYVDQGESVRGSIVVCIWEDVWTRIPHIDHRHLIGVGLSSGVTTT